ncbi:hypothetical protein D3C86_1680600 [compost metagenome]
MSYHYLSVFTHPGHHKSKLTVAMSTLVQVHKIHINATPWNVTVELGMQVKQRFLKDIQTSDPHFRRREGMHPGDYANTIYIDISLLQRFKYLLRCFYYGFIYDLNGDLWRGIQLFPVKVLASGNEPDF